MLQFRETKEGTVLEVRLQPRASQNKISGVRDGALHLRVTAPPVEGEANRAVLELLAGALGEAKSRLEIVAGHKSRDKSVLIRGLPPEEVTRRLERFIQ